ncbi:MAG: IS1634 family transposase [Sphaerochaetaceae bacterium]
MVSQLSSPKVIEIVNKKNHVTYLYEDQYYWDPDKKQTRHKRRCIGKLDKVTGEPLYNPAYQQQLENRGAEAVKAIPTFRSFVFEQLQEVIEQELSLRLLLEPLIAESKIEKLLNLAWYLICSGKPLSYALHWKGGIYESVETRMEMKELLRSLDAEFLRLWQQRCSENLAVDTQHVIFDLCSTASYENHNPFLQYGYNRDSEALEQNTIVLLAHGDSHLPYSFQLLDGTMLSSRTITRVMDTMEVGPDVILMLNRRYFSIVRIQELAQLGYQFIIRIPSRKRWLEQCIEMNQEAIAKGTPLKDYQGRTLRSVSLPAPFLKEESLTIHLYYDEQWREIQRSNLLSLLGRCKRELEFEEPLEEHARLYETFFRIRKRPNGSNRVTLSRDPLRTFESSQTGFWALITNCGLSAQEALAKYEQRNHFEYRFNNLLNQDDCRILHIQSPQYYPGRVFLQLISEIIRQNLLEKLKGSEYSLSQALFAVSALQEVTFSQNDIPYRSEPNEREKLILQRLGVVLEEET